jgi:hypothetical protein
MTRRERTHPRVPYGSTVKVWKARTPEDIRALDLSRGGLFLRTEEDIPAGSYLTLTIELPQGPRFTALCRVAHREDGRIRRGLGLEFIDVAPKALAAIEEYVTVAEERARALA